MFLFLFLCETMDYFKLPLGRSVTRAHRAFSPVNPQERKDNHNYHPMLVKPAGINNRFTESNFTLTK